jgi:hypothetical protein
VGLKDTSGDGRLYPKLYSLSVAFGVIWYENSVAKDRRRAAISDCSIAVLAEPLDMSLPVSRSTLRVLERAYLMRMDQKSAGALCACGRESCFSNVSSSRPDTVAAIAWLS